MYIVPDDVFNARFWARTEPTQRGCWRWTGPVQGRGYGQINRHYKKYLAHRYAYMLAVGPIPGGMVVCHTCDNRLCINPAHLFLGTQADNMQDMWRKGRQPDPATKARGSRHPKAKLTEADIPVIRALVGAGYRRPDVAAQFGVSLGTVDQIVRRRIWQHVA